MGRSSATKSGIPGIGRIPWGSHCCHFYRTREELLQSIIPYFAAGLKNRELCVWATASPLYTDEARTALARVVPALPDLERRGWIEFVDHYDWYTDNRCGHPVKDLVRLEAKALKAGFNGLRLSGNCSWLTRQDCPEFHAYEARVTQAVRHRRMVVICSYNLDLCEGAHVYESIRNHHVTLSCRRNRDWEMLASAKA